MKLLAFLTRRKPVLQQSDPVKSPETLEAEKQHRELMQRADQAVGEAFRHAEEAAQSGGRYRSVRQQPKVQT